MKSLYWFPVIFLLGCATLHHVQLSDIDNRTQYVSSPIEIMVSETGVSVKEAKDLTKAFMKNSSDRQSADNVASIIEMFQVGPRTGLPVYNETYAQHVIDDLRSQCPSGRITGVESIREARKYPVISGEIVKIKAYCLREKGT